ncbi:MAG: hypothetical protein PV354_11035, partial [Bartonella sp.]|nr:hypothetical protein [Bartonella sp.]
SSLNTTQKIPLHFLQKTRFKASSKGRTLCFIPLNKAGHPLFSQTLSNVVFKIASKFLLPLKELAQIL